MNRRTVLGDYVNRRWVNAVGALVVLVTIALGAMKILAVLGLLNQ